MRVLALFLVLAVLSGCHARSVPLEDWPTDFKETVSRLNEYFTELNTKAEEAVAHIKTAKISEELDALIQNSMTELSMYNEDLQKRLLPVLQVASENSLKDAQGLAEKLNHHMGEATGQMEKYGEELQAMVEQSAEDIRVRFSAYINKLSKRINKDTEEIQRHVSGYVEEIQSRSSNNMDDIRERLEPLVEKVREKAETKISDINGLLKPHLQDMETKVQTAAEDVKDNVENVVQEFSNWILEMVRAMKEKL